DTGVASRDLCFRIFRIEIDVGKDASIGIPAPQLRLELAEHELPARRTSSFNDQPGMWLGGGIHCWRYLERRLRLARCEFGRLRAARHGPAPIALRRAAESAQVRPHVRLQGGATFVAVLGPVEV